MMRRIALATALATSTVLMTGCGSQGTPPGLPPDPLPTATTDLLAACQQMADVDQRPQLTYDQAQQLVGRSITTCSVAIPPAKGNPEIRVIPANVTTQPGFVDSVATDRPPPKGCDTVAQSSALLFVVNAAFVEARQCGTSGNA